MKHIISLFVSFVLIFAFECLNPQILSAQEPILENYSIGYGSGEEATNSGINVTLFDKFFGGGTAKAFLEFTTKNNSGNLTLKVWRNVRKGEISFALLVFRIEVRGYDSQSEVVYSRDLDGFTFGDSKSGNWSKKLHNLPASIQQIKVSYVGNYE